MCGLSLEILENEIVSFDFDPVADNGIYVNIYCDWQSLKHTHTKNNIHIVCSNTCQLQREFHPIPLWFLLSLSFQLIETDTKLVWHENSWWLQVGANKYVMYYFSEYKGFN